MRSLAAALAACLALGAVADSWWREPLPELPRTPAQLLEVSHMAALVPTAMMKEADAELLAAVALSEDPWAPAAVMWTVLNRARSSGRTVLEVAAEPEQFHGWVRGRDPRTRWRGEYSRAHLEITRELARAVLEGSVADPTGGALFFHRRGSWTPPWAPPRSAWTLLGRSAFYAV